MRASLPRGPVASSMATPDYQRTLGCDAAMGLIQSRNPNFLRKKGVGPNFADWLAPDEHTNKDLLATAYWALIANMMSEMAKAIGNESRHNTLSRGRAEHSQCFSESLYQARRANLNGSPMDLGNLLNRSILPALNRCAVCGKPKEECRKAASKGSGTTRTGNKPVPSRRTRENDPGHPSPRECLNDQHVLHQERGR